MEAETIRRAFAHHPVYAPLSSDGLRPAAALVPIACDQGVWLTKRSVLLPTHAGQVSFPGGKIEAEDASPEAAALRETQEEVGLDPARAEILGRLPDFVTATGFHITPVVALLPVHTVLHPQTMEVDEIFALPFSALLNPNYPVPCKKVLRGEERTFWVWPNQTHEIWGATAEILRQLALLLRAAG